MTVDVHAHLHHHHEDFTDTFRTESRRAHPDGAEVDLTVHWEAYRAGAPADTVSIVFGGKARRAGIWVDDAKIAALAEQYPQSVVGFMSLDPTQPGWQEMLRHGHQELGLRGIKLMPMYAGFDPSDAAIDDLFAYAEANGLPIVAHTGTTFISQAPLEYARPVHFDEVAMRHPELRLVLAHLSHPYEGECIAMIRKHANVYADLSALYYRPFQLWHSLRLVQDYGVWHKVLFGSDYPFATVNDTIEGLRRLAALPGIPGLDPLDPAGIEGIIARDALTLLGLALDRS